MLLKMFQDIKSYWRVISDFYVFLKTFSGIMSKQPFNPKQLTNDILTQIMKMYELDTKKIAKIQSYISKKELQNEKGLDKYIDMILTERAEKKEQFSGEGIIHISICLFFWLF